MKEANIVQIGTPNDIVSSPINEYVKTFVVDNLQTKVDSLINFTRSNE